MLFISDLAPYRRLLEIDFALTQTDRRHRRGKTLTGDERKSRDPSFLCPPRLYLALRCGGGRGGEEE